MLRKGLVIIQFSIASVLIVATIVVYQQMQLAKSISLGYDRDNLILVNKVDGQYDSFKNQLLTHPDILSVTRSHVVPTENPRSTTVLRIPGSELTKAPLGINNNFVGYDFFTTYNIKLIAGRLFSEDFGQDLYFENDEQPGLSSGNIIVNDELLKRLGKTAEEILGQTVLLGSADDPERLQVIGVVEASYYSSIHSSVEPMAYYLYPTPTNWRLFLPRTSIKIKQGAPLSALNHIDKTWRSLQTGVQINRTFLDDKYNALYQNDIKQSHMLNVFSLLAIIITCLGLFGLASFTTQRRTKEIGIRKILGASRNQISWLITKEFTQLVILSNFIAWPLAYYFMQDWLDTFANRISLSPSMFLISAALTLLVAWLTVGGLAFKAASNKPVNSLRSE